MARNIMAVWKRRNPVPACPVAVDSAADVGVVPAY
jgi:hypothetical protein